MNQPTTVASLAATFLLAISAAANSQAPGEPMVRFGIVTDLHHTNRPDTPTRKYSASLAKTKTFISSMTDEKADFIIELGDFVDTLVEQKDPAENLAELETEFTSFNGPSYHVIGNHEFDDLTRANFLNSITNTGIPHGETYYSWDTGGVHFIVLDAGYTTTEPHRAFDMNTPEDTFWNWKDAYIPEQEVEWLIKDLQASNLPTVIFTHQTMDRLDDQEHNIKNSSQVRQIFEEDGQVLAVFSGHDHAGGYANIKGIHYVVLSGNVGVSDSRTWHATSDTEGFDVVADNQFSLVEITRRGHSEYKVTVKGYGRQPTYVFNNEL